LKFPYGGKGRLEKKSVSWERYGHFLELPNLNKNIPKQIKFKNADYNL